MKPVITVPAIAPMVPIPDSRPTTVPVSARLVSRSLVTIGVTAASRDPGTMMLSDDTRISTRAQDAGNAPAARTANGVRATATPDTASSGPIARSGEMRSASRPPDQEPTAMAASAVPMTIVLVSSVSPRNGASRRREVSSTTSTAADEPATRAAASYSRRLCRPVSLTRR